MFKRIVDVYRAHISVKTDDASRGSEHKIEVHAKVTLNGKYMNTLVLLEYLFQTCFFQR